MKPSIAGCALLCVVLAAGLSAGCGSGPADRSQASVTYCPLSTEGAVAYTNPCEPEPPPPRCTSFDYGPWSRCTGTGVQTCTVTARYPAGCTGGSPTTSQACTSYDVGVIPFASGTCNIEEVWFLLDDEDTGTDNAKGYVDCSQTPCAMRDNWHYGYSTVDARSLPGWIGATEVGKDTVLRFCRVDGLRFFPHSTVPDAQTEYAVLKLGTTCPPGSLQFDRLFDTEDDNNWSNAGGNIAPNTWNPYNTNLQFCVFQHGAAGTDAEGNPQAITDPVTGTLGFQDLGFSYGVLANRYATGYAGALGWIFIDDEDERNANQLNPDPEHPEIMPAVTQMIWGGTDTYMVFGLARYQ